jgi:hypothetical protein
MQSTYDTWMEADNFKVFLNGIIQIDNYLSEYKMLISSLGLNKFSFSKDIEKISKVRNWAAELYNDSEYDEVRFRCSLETIQVLKAGGVAQIINLEREKERLKQEKAPKKLIDNIDERLSHFRELINIGVLAEIEPDTIIQYLYDPEQKDQQITDTNEVTFQYDIALSFAGEDRKYAEEIASALKAANISVFYDTYEQVSLWGVDLYEHLSTVYSEKARYCLMFLSENYAKKAWTTHERKSAQARAFYEQKEYILPLRIDNTKIPGINETIGYIDINQFTTEEIISMIISKLRTD